jgi:octaprenyl-diphosphate synthase
LLLHGTQLGGKRLRPALLLLSAKLCGEVKPEHLTLGVVIEMIHTATLIHDDVLDEADVRRHSPTINRRYNNHTSILLGDYLFAQSFRMAARMPSTRPCQLIGEASRVICEGELRQVMMRNDTTLDESTYLEILNEKTAELCRVSCVLGAEMAGASAEQIDALGRYGCSLGIAFQVADDYLDVWGNDHSIGKTLGTDLIQGKITLPIIRLLDQANDTDRNKILSILNGPSEARFAKLQPLLNKSDARLYTHQVARRFQDAAIGSLAVFESSIVKEALIGLAELAVDREI